MQWRGSTLVDNLIKKAPLCASPQQLAAYAGLNNIAKLAEAINDFNPDDSTKISSVNGRSIFTNEVDAWHEFFRIIATDFFGVITCTRAIASIFVDGGYYGELAGVAKWLPHPHVLKVKNKIYAFIEHTYLHYEDLSVWPERCVMYAVSPQDIDTYCVVMKKAPAAVILPLTGLSDSSKHLRSLLTYASAVELLLIFAQTPLVAFVPKATGLAINSVISNLRALEQHIVGQCLRTFRNICQSFKTGFESDEFFAWSIRPTETYGPGKCHVSFVGTHRMSTLYYKNHSYMGKSDIEKKLFVATSHLSDLQIDGVVKKAAVETKVGGKYPRAFPNGRIVYEKLFIAGKTYQIKTEEDGKLVCTEYETDFRPDIYNWDVKSPQPEVKRAPFPGYAKPAAPKEAPKDEPMKESKEDEPMKEKKDEEEGEIKEPTTPTYKPDVSPPPAKKAKH